ncbi:hypothetical protein AQUCO_03600146v1 [Aquilegia coerulea]|uniref:TTF-type domain-containing protein n=1 Tax=Aquilegia coerulea TaxID=218851 RepID=A0A2G5CVH0_AQUCA|nr:hypothetical protein AQUCO_03600146v1 [Aquilegia coerulea]
MSNPHQTPKLTKPRKTIDSFFKPKDGAKSDVASISEVEPTCDKNEDRPSKTPIFVPEAPNLTHNVPSIILEEVDLTTSFERDPGLRTSIWKYPVNKRDEVRRAYLKMGPYKLPSNYVFPLTWCTKYSPTTDKAYCFPCFLFETNPPKCHAYTIDGFNSWKGVNNSTKCSFLTHVGGPCSPHILAVRSCEDLMRASQHVNNLVIRQSKEDVMKNRLRLKTTIEIFSTRCNTEVASVVLENAPKNAMYISHSIQKEVLHIMAEIVRKKIREEVGDGKFCILVDEAQDNSTREQIAIVLRLVDDGGLVRERFLAIKEISNVLACFNLHVCHMRGQGYDGASNMRGAWNGLQALFLKESPCAYYIHCFAHRLQLVLVGASKDTQDVWLFFSKLASILNLVGASPKCKSELQSAQEYEIEKLLATGDIQTGKGANQIGNLQRAGATRWSSHFASISRLIEMYNATSTVLESITRTGSTNSMRGETKGVNIQMGTFEFVFILHLMHKTMGITNVLVSTTKTLLQELKNENWDTFLDSVVSFCKQHDIDIPDMNDRYRSGTRRSCHQKDDITIRHHYHFDLFIVVIDHQLMELNHRFTDDAMELLKLSSAFDPRDAYKSFDINDICTLAEKYYLQDFKKQEINILRKTRKAKIYSLVDKLIRLVLTLPVSTTTTELAFSAMKLIKTLLRNKMDDEFLADLMVLHIEREYAKELDLDAVIKEFEAVPRRVQFH